MEKDRREEEEEGDHGVGRSGCADGEGEEEEEHDLCGVVKNRNDVRLPLLSTLRLVHPDGLTSLVLSHNDLVCLPEPILHLPHLAHLDLSFNLLSTLPPEIGRMTSLQSLNLLANPLVSLPAEMQALTGLKKLKISNATKKKLVNNPQLFMRYMKTMPFKPIKDELPHRRMLHTDDAPTQRFRVMTYNILAPQWTDPNGDHECPGWAHKWSYRKRKILWEILHYQADIVCFQEIEKRAYEGYIGFHLNQLGFDGVFQPPAQERPIDGFVSIGKNRYSDHITFYHNFRLAQVQKLEFMHLIDQLPSGEKVNKYFRAQFRMSDKQAMLLMLEVLLSSPADSTSVDGQAPRFLCLANTHIFWDPTYPSIKLMQVFLLTQAIEQAVINWKNMHGASDLPVIICGDFNSLPDSSVYRLLSLGRLDPGHDDLPVTLSLEFARLGLAHSLDLVSAYAQFLHRLDNVDPDALPAAGAKKRKRRKKRKKKNLRQWEPPFTNLTPSFRGTLDYIWISSNSSTSSEEPSVEAPPRNDDERVKRHQPNESVVTPEDEEEAEREEEPSNNLEEALREDDAHSATEEEEKFEENNWRLHVCGILEPVVEDRVRKNHQPKSRTSLLGVTFPSDHYALLCELAFVRST